VLQAHGWITENNLFLLLSGVQLQKRWKNIRDSYFRELRRLKNIRSGAAAPKRNSYIHFQQLHFLKGAAGTSSETHRPPQNKKRAEDCIGLEMVNVLRSTLQESERHDSDILFLLSLVDDFKKIPDYSKSSAKIEMIKLIQSYQPKPVFSALKKETPSP
jgi:hypothetical protein